MTLPLLLATRNQGKIAELRTILAEVGLPQVEVLGVEDFPGLPEVAETGLSFAENALLKASSAATHCAAAGRPVLAVADDSGLAVEVLGGMPGIFSARWAGRHGDDTANLALLLDQLADVPAQHRQAAFVCAAVAVDPNGQQYSVQAQVEGQLAEKPLGINGFGYDPVFVPGEDTRTMAQLSPQEKNAISHRGRAFRALAEQLQQVWG